MRALSRVLLVIGALLTAGAFWAPPSASAASHVLLIGVSKYPKEAQWLQGPPNDVAALWAVLRQRGVPAEAIRVLAEAADLPDSAIPVVGSPTRAAITGELERLGRVVAPGDDVLIFYSGHGARQPDASGDETDGYDEILLPADIGVWESETSQVENAISDDEIGTFLTRIRERGAFVWVIVDACYSGTVTRAASKEYWRTRRVPETSLGIPSGPATVAGPQETDAAPMALATKGGQLGGLVAFFAAQADEPAVESLFPRDYEATDRRPHGMLSFYLAKALASEPAASYRELGRRILAGYDSFSGRAPQPYFEGELDRPALGAATPSPVASADTPPGHLEVRRTSGKEAVLSAGQLQGVTDGLPVTLYDLDGTPVEAKARVVQAGIAESLLTLEGDELYRLPRQLSAELELPERPLTVARIDADTGDGAALDAAVAEAVQSLPLVELVPADAVADIHLAVREARLWLLPPGGWPSSAPERYLPVVELSGTPQENAQRLAELLAQIRKSRALLGLLDRPGAGRLSGALQVRTYLQYAPDREAGEQRTCTPRRSTPSVPDPAQEIDPLRVPRLAQCDTLFVELRNTGRHPIDLTLFYVDSFERPWPVEGFDGRRLEPGAEAIVLPLQVFTWNWQTRQSTGLGLEHLLIVGVERSERADLSFNVGLGYLAGERVPSTRGARTEPFVRALEALALPGPRVRSAERGTFNGGDVVSVRWRLVTEGEG